MQRPLAFGRCAGCQVGCKEAITGARAEAASKPCAWASKPSPASGFDAVRPGPGHSYPGGAGNPAPSAVIARCSARPRLPARPMNRLGPGSGGGSPILVGAVTCLVTVIAVFLSYNANQGLPFVPTYDVSVQLPDAAGLVAGNDVRIGGKRIGTITKISARKTPQGRTL